MTSCLVLQVRVSVQSMCDNCVIMQSLAVPVKVTVSLFVLPGTNKCSKVVLMVSC